MSETFRFVIQTICPVHIGCDEVYDPLSFYVDGSKQEVVCFSPLDLIRYLSEEKLKALSRICQKGTMASLLEVYKFMSHVTAEGRRIKASPGFVEHYNETLRIPADKDKKIRQGLNQFIIWRTAFLVEDDRPYIPGSAIKGCLRTAYLNAIARQKKLKRFKAKEAKELEKALLDGGQFSTDPFRCVKVSDFRPIGEVRTRIAYAVNEKKSASRFRARGPSQIVEIIEPGSFFEGSLTIEEPHPKAGIKNPISMDALLDSLRGFYGKEKEREQKELKAIGVPETNFFQGALGAPMRLGRHSGAECVTIEGHRSIKIMGKRGEKPRWERAATTLWLVSPSPRPNGKLGLLPFGWVSFIGPDPEILPQLEQEERQWRKQLETSRLEAFEQRRRERQRQLEKAMEIEKAKAEEERKAREEEERRAYLESLTPEERDIAVVKDPETPEDEVVKIYGRIDEFPEAKKRELAIALKEYWTAKGKWSGKLSKKQKKKVEKIKGILQEG